MSSRLGWGMCTRKSGPIANSAVPTSTNMTPYKGNNSISKAPKGGLMIFRAPFMVWFNPATRARCSLGTISEVEACIAGQ